MEEIIFSIRVTNSVKSSSSVNDPRGGNFILSFKGSVLIKAKILQRDWKNVLKVLNFFIILILMKIGRKHILLHLLHFSSIQLDKLTQQ